MDLRFALILFIPLGLNLSIIYLSFLDWYERELRAIRYILICYLLSLVIVSLLYEFGSVYLSAFERIYTVVATTVFFLVFPEIYLLTAWLRKGAHKSFIILSVLSYTAIFWLTLPSAFLLIGVTGVVMIIIATYIAGVILGTLISVGVIKEIEIKDGFFTASAATASLSLSDAVSQYLQGFSIFGNYLIHLIVIIVSYVLSFYIYRKAVR